MSSVASTSRSSNPPSIPPGQIPNPIHAENRVYYGAMRAADKISSSVGRVFSLFSSSTTASPTPQPAKIPRKVNKWEMTFVPDQQSRMKPIWDVEERKFKIYPEAEDHFWKTMDHTFKTNGTKIPTPSTLPSIIFPDKPTQCPPVDGNQRKLTALWGGHNTWIFNYKPTPQAEELCFIFDPNFERQFDLIPALNKNYKRLAPFRVEVDSPPRSENSDYRETYLKHQQDGVRRLDPKVVFQTHNHTDHWEPNSIKILQEGDPYFFVPLGDGDNPKTTKTHEFNWFDSVIITNSSDTSRIRATFVPADHASYKKEKASIFNPKAGSCTALWGGWVIECLELLTGDDPNDSHHPLTVYVVGDTAFDPKKSHHAQFANEIARFFRIDFCIAPIDPTSGEEESHANTQQILAFLDVIKPRFGWAPAHVAWAWSENVLKPFQELHRVAQSGPLGKNCTVFEFGQRSSIFPPEFQFNLDRFAYPTSMKEEMPSPYLKISHFLGIVDTRVRGTWRDEIIDGLFLGALPQKEHQTELEATFAAVISFVEDWELQPSTLNDAIQPGDWNIPYLRLPTQDQSAVSKEDMQKAISIIETYHKNGQKVLVTCKSGRSRSALAVTVYMAKKHNKTPNEMFKVVQAKRSIVTLNSQQRSVLNNYLK